MALPSRLARYQSLLDLLVEAALREMEDEAAVNVVDVEPNSKAAPDLSQRRASHDLNSKGMP